MQANENKHMQIIKRVQKMTITSTIHHYSSGLEKFLWEISDITIGSNQLFLGVNDFAATHTWTLGT